MMHSDQCLRSLFELLKEPCPGAALGPMVKFGVNVSSFAVFDGQCPATQRIGKRMKDGDKECPVVLVGTGSFPKIGGNISIMKSSIFSQIKKTRLARCWFFFSAFLPGAPVARVFFFLFGKV